ncbi:MAG: hypothetical protein K2J48_01755 [Muribaculaceae bacterium]|nr:hypothetical protein [Muribaculaceae bacterium]
MVFLPPTPPPADQDNILDAMNLSEDDVVFFDNEEDTNDHINLYSTDGSCEEFSCGSATCSVHICGKHDCNGFKCGDFEDNTDHGDCIELTETPPHNLILSE